MRLRLFNDDKGIFNKLIGALQKLDKYPWPVCIPEIIHLSNFGTDELCAQGFSPRWIIEKMMERHAYTQQYIGWNFDALQQFSSLHLDSDQKVHQYTFTNVMPFYIDIHILCHLYFLVLRLGLDKEPLVMELMKMMEEKYEINTQYESMTDLHAKVVTLSRIAHSYPSIMSDIFSDKIDSTALFFFSLFPNLKILPKMIFLPTITSLLPSLDDYPIAVLIAITLILESYSGLRTKTPLTTIYLNILRARKSTAFSENLKFELCWKWGIIHVKNDSYTFLPSFESCREVAKYLITEMRPEDSGLKLLLPLL